MVAIPLVAPVTSVSPGATVGSGSPARGPGVEPTIVELLAKVRAYHPSADLNLIQRAFIFAEQHHRPQRRKNGEPYVGHPVAVAHILADMKLDEGTLCAALLHDTVEDTSATHDDLVACFGADIAHLVDGVTKLSKIRFRSKEEKQAENFRKMLIAMSQDIRVILVKLADRTHNMRTLDHLASDKQAVIAQETMDIFAPLANRLGLGSVKIELEDLSFRYLHPEKFQDLKAAVDKRLDERKDYVSRVLAEIEAIVQKEGIAADVSGRPKHFWSIYRKMQRQAISIDKVYDSIAFRVLVDKQSDCYHVLGLIHDRWRPIPGRFKDYIALPKPNRYQSLHTTVIGPDGQPIEVQIRTHAMHRIAEGGIAAHWKYKDGGKLDAKDEERFDWLKRLMEWQREFEDPSEFLESVKIELFADEVYTFTPKGELKVLPRGSTPVDFAYSVHSDVGATCSGAIVNGHIVPLTYMLKNGDVVEVIRNKNQKPNKDWLKFVRTTRAKDRIKAFIKKEQRQRSLELGENLLDKELRRYSRSLLKVRKSAEIEQAAKTLGFDSVEELIVQVGMGNITPESVTPLVLPEELVKKEPKVAPAQQSMVGRLIDRMRGSKRPAGVVVDGLDGVKHSLARCCTPVPGEPIVGYVTPGHVISVHRKGCVNTVDIATDRMVEVQWGESGGAGYPVSVRVVTESGIPGLLNKMTKVFSDLKINIDAAMCAETPDGRAENVFKFHAKHLDELTDVSRKLESLRGVHSVSRVRA
ncbi:MAG: bifunctional (p)ppGpp synthetase/guanosine-3',5'-bis(diphosphate) 3'-pyrophosphohydrolase [Deltaproteobacteria bacterium]|nr:bifunctional (p)ppGpp synthetase/guanosine-3',5'-bis(diphosphate) 3'-pyrophosphohydrolase [Deltaproteobacteria bacterium]